MYNKPTVFSLRTFDKFSNLPDTERKGSSHSTQGKKVHIALIGLPHFWGLATQQRNIVIDFLSTTNC